MTTPNDATAIREQWMKSNQIDEDTGGYLHAHYSDIDQLIVSLLQEASAPKPTGDGPYEYADGIIDARTPNNIYEKARDDSMAEIEGLKECLAIAKEELTLLATPSGARNQISATHLDLITTRQAQAALDLIKELEK